MQIKTFVFNPIQENTYVVWDSTKECIVIDAGNLSAVFGLFATVSKI